MTAHVATVRHSESVPVNFQIARMDATAATTMQTVVVQNENLRTTRGFRKPFGGDPFGTGICAGFNLRHQFRRTYRCAVLGAAAGCIVSALSITDSTFGREKKIGKYLPRDQSSNRSR
jgi:hypothetical protein